MHQGKRAVFLTDIIPSFEGSINQYDMSNKSSHSAAWDEQKKVRQRPTLKKFHSQIRKINTGLDLLKAGTRPLNIIRTMW